jgi:hypothetical protein
MSELKHTFRIYKFFSLYTMVKKKTSPKTSLIVTGRCEVTKSAKAKALEAAHTKSLGKRGKGSGTSKKKGKGRKRALPSDDKG